MTFSIYDGSKIADAAKSVAKSLYDAADTYRKNADTARAVALMDAAKSATDDETARTLLDEAYQILLP